MKLDGVAAMRKRPRSKGKTFSSDQRKKTPLERGDDGPKEEDYSE